MTSLDRIHVTNEYNLDTYGFKYNDNIYYYDYGIKVMTNGIIREIKNIFNPKAFVIVNNMQSIYIIAIEVYFTSSDHYFDRIDNNLTIIDCNTELCIKTININECNNIYIDRIYCIDGEIKLYDKYDSVVWSKNIDSLLVK
jgi:hypothetical protein